MTEADRSQWRDTIALASGLSRLGLETVLAVIGPSPSQAQKAATSAIAGLTLSDSKIAVDWRCDDAIRRAGEAIRDIAKSAEVDIVQLSRPALAAGTRFESPVVAVIDACVATSWQAAYGSALPGDLASGVRLVQDGLHAADVVVAPSATFGEAVHRHYRLAAAPRTVHVGRDPPTQSAVAIAAILAPEGGVLFETHLGVLEEEDAALHLAARPIFVCPALHASSGAAVLDAAAAGCALILSDIPVFRELWDGVARFVPARDEAGFTGAVADLIRDDFERARLGDAARQRATRFTADAMAAQMASIYRALLPAVRGPVLAAARAA